MNGVGYSSPFVPVEWIAAHGLRPERLRLHPSEKLTRGICPYAGALMAAGLAPGSHALRGNRPPPTLCVEADNAPDTDRSIPTQSVGTRISSGHAPTSWA